MRYLPDERTISMHTTVWETWQSTNMFGNNKILLQTSASITWCQRRDYLYGTINLLWCRIMPICGENCAYLDIQTACSRPLTSQFPTQWYWPPLPQLRSHYDSNGVWETAETHGSVMFSTENPPHFWVLSTMCPVHWITQLEGQYIRHISYPFSS